MDTKPEYEVLDGALYEKAQKLQESLQIFRSLPFQALPNKESEDDMRILAELHHQMGFMHTRL